MATTKKSSDANQAEATSDAAALEALAALTTSNAKRTKFGRFLTLFFAIEEALASGVRQNDVRQELQRFDLELTPATFKTFLERARRRTMPSAPEPPRRPAPPTTTPIRSTSMLPWPPPAAPSMRNQPVDLDGLSKLSKQGTSTT